MMAFPKAPGITPEAHQWEVKGVSKWEKSRGHTSQRLSAVLGKRARPHSAEALCSTQRPPGEGRSPGHTVNWASNSTVSGWCAGQGAGMPRPAVRSICLSFRHLQQNLNSRWETLAPRSWENKMAEILHELHELETPTLMGSEQAFPRRAALACGLS